MPSVVTDYLESWDTAGTTFCRTGDHSVRLIIYILSASSVSANSGYMGISCYLETDTAHWVVSEKRQSCVREARGTPKEFAS